MNHKAGIELLTFSEMYMQLATLHRTPNTQAYFCPMNASPSLKSSWLEITRKNVTKYLPSSTDSNNPTPATHASHIYPMVKVK